jgi:hypothetical protein
MERRDFLRSVAFSGGLVTTSAIVHSCSSTTEAADGDFTEDEPIVRNGAEFEAMGIKTYEVAAASGLIKTQAYLDVAVQFMGDHAVHLEELNKLLTTNGFDAVDSTNADPDPGVGSVDTEQDVLNLALSVEFQAATFYFSNIVTAIKSPQARTVFANILPVETAHFTAYKSALGYAPAIDGAIFENMTSGLD